MRRFLIQHGSKSIYLFFIAITFNGKYHSGDGPFLADPSRHSLILTSIFIDPKTKNGEIILWPWDFESSSRLNYVNRHGEMTPTCMLSVVTDRIYFSINLQRSDVNIMRYEVCWSTFTFIIITRLRLKDSKFKTTSNHRLF